MSIHPWAAAGFGRAAESYERGRPGYPPEAVAWLAERLGLGSGTTVVDLGAGTGKLSRLLAATGTRVVAVEPVDEMRAFLERTPGVEALAGTAEAIPLPDASADAVTVAQAFHWFRFEEALTEMHRVLRPGGALALVRNRLDRRDPLTDAFAAILDLYRDHPALDAGAWPEALPFAPRELETFAHGQTLDAAALAERAASESSIAILPGPRLREALDAVRALAPETATLRYVTEVAISPRRP